MAVDELAAQIEEASVSDKVRDELAMQQHPSEALTVPDEPLSSSSKGLQADSIDEKEVSTQKIAAT